MADVQREEIDALVREMDRARDAWVHGRLEREGTDCMVQAPDMTLFGAFGGVARNGPDLETRQARAAARFRGGAGSTEVVNAVSAGDLLVLVLIERSEVLFDGHDKPQPWVLRTTQIFRRDGDRWLRLHRHADPLCTLQPFEAVVALANQAAS